VGAKLGLPAGIPIAIGEFDVHYGAIGCGVEERVLVKVIGTSTCDCGVVSAQKNRADIPGICGIVKGAILPGLLRHRGRAVGGGRYFQVVGRGGVPGRRRAARAIHAEAPRSKPGQSGLLALDWNNGNRTILVDPLLTGLLVGQTLHTTPAEIYRALIEATAFGARAIIERIRNTACRSARGLRGGIAEKNPLLMQIYADVTGCTMRVAGSSQACALGSAVAAAVLAGGPSRLFPARRRR
jgi:L-ribulokinase